MASTTDEQLDLADYPLWHGVVPMSVYAARLASPSKFLVHADGCWVEDVAGRRYLDARAGICNVNLGYGRTDIAEAMYQQALDLPYACIIRYERPAATTVEYARALASVAPPGLTRVRLTHMGSASVENALLMTRLLFKNSGRPEKTTVISLRGSYHGTTYLTMTASGDDDLHTLYAPMAPGFRTTPAPFHRACAHCGPGFACNQGCIDELERLILQLGPERVAALILEPVMGNQVIPLPIQYMQRARELCNKYELLLIFDEIVTAFGRTGHLFASQYYGITPDIMCLAKGITGGYAPLGAVLTSEQVFEQFNHAGAMFFANGSSTDGHPVSCAAGLATLRAFEREDVIPQARERFTRFREELRRSLAGHELVAEVRGVGALLGIEVVDQGDFDATMILLHRIRMACERRGVLVHFTDGVLILVPPLTISDDELTLLGETVIAALDEVLPSSTARRTA